MIHIVKYITTLVMNYLPSDGDTDELSNDKFSRCTTQKYLSNQSAMIS